MLRSLVLLMESEVVGTTSPSQDGCSSLPQRRFGSLCSSERSYRVPLAHVMVKYLGTSVSMGSIGIGELSEGPRGLSRVDNA